MAHQFYTQLQFLFSSFVSAMICIGVGGFWIRLFGLAPGLSRLSLHGAFGILWVGILSLAFNFFFALGGAHFLFLLSLSISGWILIARSESWVSVKTEIPRLLIFIACYWVIGIRRVVQSDTGLYHIPIIHTMHQLPLPLGFGNIHGRFGTWNFWFSVCGGLSAGDVLPFATYGMNMVLVAFASIDFRDWLKRRDSRVLGFASAIFLYVSMIDTWFFAGGQKSPDADFAGAVISWWTTGWFLTRHGENKSWAGPVLILSGLCVLLKLNQLPMGIFAYVVLLRFGVRSNSWYLFSVCSGLFLLVMKSFWVTGCLLYPVLATRLNVSWAIRSEDILEMYNTIVQWGRWPQGPVEQVLHSWKWIPHWASSLGGRLIYFFESSVLILFVAMMIFRSFRKRMDWTAVMVAFLTLIYWFFTAPDPRFATGALLMIPSLVFGVLFEQALISKIGFWIRRFFLIAGLFFLILFGLGQLRRVDDWGAGTLHEPEPRFIVKKNVLGQQVYVPIENECWRLPVPCTPYFVPEITEYNWLLWKKFVDLRAQQ